MTSPQFTVPTRSHIQDPRVILREAQLHAWLEQQPFANPSKIAGLLAESLARLNRQPVPAERRLGLLEIWHSAALRVLLPSGLQDANEVAHSARSKIVVDQLAQLTRELAYGFKILINEWSDVGGKEGYHPKLPQAVFRALELNAHTLLQHYERYLGCPPQALDEAFRLHALASQHRFATRPLSLPPEDAQPLSIEQLMQWILLLGICDPFRLPQGEIWRVYLYLRQNRAIAKIYPGNGGQDRQAGCFVIEPDNRNPFVTATAQPPGPKALLLDADQTLAQLDRNRKQLQTGAAGDFWMPYANRRANDRFLAQLLKRWTQKPERRHPRKSARAEVQFHFGLSAIHSVLSAGQGFDPRAYLPSQNLNEIEITSVRSGLSEAVSRDYTPLNCQLLDHGPGGLSIELSPQAREIRIGQLVMFTLKRDAMDEPWHLGVIRWFGELQNGVRRAGIQHLTQKAAAVAVGPAGASKTLYPGLLYATKNRSRRLIVESGQLANTHIRLIERPGSEEQRMDTELLEPAGTFDLLRLHN